VGSIWKLNKRVDSFKRLEGISQIIWSYNKQIIKTSVINNKVNIKLLEEIENISLEARLVT